MNNPSQLENLKEMPAGQKESPTVLYVTICQYRLLFYLYRSKYIKQLVLTSNSSWAAPGKPGSTVHICQLLALVGSYKGQLTNAVLKHQPTSQREKPWNHFQNGMGHFSNTVFTTGEHFLMGQLAFSSSHKTCSYIDHIGQKASSYSYATLTNIQPLGKERHASLL
jgi:hypothetical protein